MTTLCFPGRKVTGAAGVRPMLVVGKVLHFLTARLRERREKMAILSRHQNACTCAEHMLGMVGSTDLRLPLERDNSRRSTGHAWWQLFSPPCLSLHPSEHGACIQFIWREREDGTSYEIVQKESAVISSPSSNTRCWRLLQKVQTFTGRIKTPVAGIWHLSTGQDNRKWMPWIWALELLLLFLTADSWSQRTKSSLPNPNTPSSFSPQTAAPEQSVQRKWKRCRPGFRRWSGNHCFVTLQLMVLPYSGRAVQNTGDKKKKKNTTEHTWGHAYYRTLLPA